MPRIFQSIRFRLSLAFSLVVFSVGTMLVGGIYLYQVNQLDDPVVPVGQVVIKNPRTGEFIETNLQAIMQDEIERAIVEQIQVNAYRDALNELRKASLSGLGVLFLVSFGTGWIFSGWTLRPVDRITGVARDITATDLSRRIALSGPDDEFKSLADTFDAMLDRLQGSFEDQRRFVHEASHELRNPLAVARANLELALDGDSEEELRAAAEIAHRSTGRMTVLVEDLLEQARAGVPELKRRPVDLARLGREIAADFAAPASERQLKLVAEIDAESVIVHGDEPAIRRSIANLVANAVRLAPESSVVRIAVESSPDCAEVKVIDEGPGIALSDHDAVFERFWRGSDAGSGSGLGLSIVKRIVERHGGTATVQSEIGQGSTFTLRLPVPIERQG